MNKGVDASNGEYSLYLNSGDYFNSYDIIEKVYDELDKDIVYGNENKLKQGRIAAHTVISVIVMMLGAEIMPSFAHRKRAGIVKIAPAATLSPAEPIV